MFNGGSDFDAQELQKKWLDFSARSGRLMQKFMSSHPHLRGDMAGFDPLNVGDVFYRLSQSMLQDPQLWWKMQQQWWEGYMNIWRAATNPNKENETPASETVSDRRFKDEAWESHALYNYLKESYLLSSQVFMSAVEEAQGFDDDERRKLVFYTKQFVDALSPSNFALTNPEVVRATYESGGENLVAGLENLLEDLESGEGRLKISMTDAEAFEVGVNLATTAGDVIYANDLMQLIQYSPLSDSVHTVPLLIIPPWINKFYVLDMTERNSFIRYAVSEGFTVFVISWVNPGASLRDKGFEDYMLEGPVAAISAICEHLGVDKVSALGYCIGGTLLACSLGYMANKGDKRIVSATYLTTLLDFADAGDLRVFIDEAQLSALEKRMDEVGYLQGEEMAQTFNMLRSNDLIWSFVVNNYLLGKEPLPFDLLYWNSDSTRLPAAMHGYYLREMYLENRLREPDGITLAGEAIDLRKIKVPAFVLSTAEDHIAPWEATYAACDLLGGAVDFVLAGSGHIAGVVNPPSKGKYDYRVGVGSARDARGWLENSERHEGSWWPHWIEWLRKRSGKQVKARIGGKFASMESAPGSYVKER